MKESKYYLNFDSERQESSASQKAPNFLVEMIDRKLWNARTLNHWSIRV